MKFSPCKEIALSLFSSQALSSLCARQQMLLTGSETSFLRWQNREIGGRFDCTTVSHTEEVLQSAIAIAKWHSCLIASATLPLGGSHLQGHEITTLVLTCWKSPTGRTKQNWHVGIILTSLADMQMDLDPSLLAALLTSCVLLYHY